MNPEIIEGIRSSILFQGIESDALSIMLDCLKPRMKRYRTREIVTSRGQPFEGIGIIAAGKIALTKEMYSGNRTIIGFLDEGDIFGETVAFSDRRVWPMTVITQDDSVVLFLPPDKISRTCSNICASHSTLIMNMLQILSNRALMLDKKIEYLSARNIRGRISSYLLDCLRDRHEPTVIIPMKRHELADYLNIPRPSLSREMGVMRDEGIIDFDGSSVTIHDARTLEEGIL
ncbi:MAG: Crp/Fnr family transcriptional regulator [Dehalococcoidales bacterium]|nr:Crp/Fnr family transcriptional regulator [Dehalococcoidales bacterium]